MADELSQAEIDALLAQGTDDIDEGGSPAEEIAPVATAPTRRAIGPVNKDIESLLMDVSLNMKIEVGRTRMSIDEILRLREGSVIELNKLAGDPVDILVNERLVAKGEILVLNEAFCIRITEIVSPKDRLARNL
ncbi:MAG: flagellar motor switch protein FliN [Planctomycetota bacterium]|nr:MAG: flagellar motor switch protein FliN [Planctomycetota bacterium]